MKKASLSLFAIFCVLTGLGSSFICHRLGLSLLEALFFAAVIVSFTGAFLYAILSLESKND
jgi:hypothetical protein